MSPTRERSKHLDFPAVYYNTPASLAVHIDNRDIVARLASGKAIGVGVATTYDNYLKAEPGDRRAGGGGVRLSDRRAAHPQLYETDQLALDDLKLGDGVKLDAVITAMPTVLRIDPRRLSAQDHQGTPCFSSLWRSPSTRAIANSTRGFGKSSARCIATAPWRRACRAGGMTPT